MRDPYVPFFPDLLSSGVWFEDPAIRCVWIALCLNTDAEGYVRLNLRGLQREANVPLDDVKRALALFEAPDPDSRDQTEQGRRIVTVDRGWHLVTFEAHRNRARLSAERARKARWDREHRPRASEPDADEPSNVGTRRKPDAQKQTPKQKQTPPSEGDLPAPPVLHAMVNYLPDDWVPSEALRADAFAAGVADLDERIRKLRTTRIGGREGVRLDKLDDYIRCLFKDWKTWGETARAKATQSGWGKPPEPAKPAPPRVKGCPLWVRESHEQMCRAEGHDVRREAMAWAKTHHINPSTLDRNIAAAAFTDHLTKLFQKGAA